METTRELRRALDEGARPALHERIGGGGARGAATVPAAAVGLQVLDSGAWVGCVGCAMVATAWQDPETLADVMKDGVQLVAEGLAAWIMPGDDVAQTPHECERCGERIGGALGVDHAELTETTVDGETWPVVRWDAGGLNGSPRPFFTAGTIEDMRAAYDGNDEVMGGSEFGPDVVAAGDGTFYLSGWLWQRVAVNVCVVCERTVREDHVYYTHEPSEATWARLAPQVWEWEHRPERAEGGNPIGPCCVGEYLRWAERVGFVDAHGVAVRPELA